jgi:hypothetical protein
LEQELLALRKKQVFNGVEITRRPERSSPNEQASPAATQVPQNCVTTTDPPVGHVVPLVLTPVVEPPIHPYSTAPESRIEVPVTESEGGSMDSLKGKEPAYKTVVPIQDPKIADTVYN